MIKFFNDKNTYSRLKRYIISNSDTPNNDRCCVFYHGKIQCTLCFNDDRMSIVICKLTYTIENGVDINNIFDYLLYLSEKHIEDSYRFKFYSEQIEPESQCCLFNSIHQKVELNSKIVYS
ncbi:MAG: hypothetical protein ACM3O3_13160 [Syntrophothermus sp.]